MSHLVPKSIVRSDGVLTTVHVNPDKFPALAKISAIAKPTSSYVDPADPSFSTGVNEPVLYTHNAQSRTALDFPGLVVASGVNIWRVCEGERHNEASGAYCKVCGEWLDLDSANTADTEWVECSECNTLISNQDNNVGVGVISEDVYLFGDTKKVIKDRTWYHSTSKGDWDVLVNTPNDSGRTPLVHLGSEDAADYRTKHLEEFAREEPLHGATRFIFLMQVKPDAVVAPNVLPDVDWRMPQYSNLPDENPVEDIGFQRDGVTAYVNQHEAIGSVSLLANTSSLVVKERREYRYDSEWLDWVPAEDFEAGDDF